MKQLLAVSALAALATACQPQTAATPPQAQAGPAAKPTAVAVVNRVGDGSASTSPVPAPVDAKSADILQRYDLSRVLQTVQANVPEQSYAMNGFYGPDRYRMELVVTKVVRDPANFNRYFLTGKDRYKGIITPLTGTIDFTRVWTRVDSMADGHGGRELTTSYSAVGHYELREDPTTKGAGVFQGQVAADMALDDKGQMMQAPTWDSPSKGGGITYDGNWTSITTGQQKAATWVVNLFEYHGPAIATDFAFGERDPQINPKYAKKGWNKYWENDEWWSNAPKVVAKSN